MTEKSEYEVREDEIPDDVFEGDFFIPDDRAPTHPGEMLKKEFLEPLDMTQRELANCMGVYVPRVNELITGKRRVTPQTAAMLSRVFKTSERFWLNLQSAYDLYKLRQSDDWEKVKDVKRAI